MDHSHSEDQLWGAVEILPQRLYYAPLKFFPPESKESDYDLDDDEHHQKQASGNSSDSGTSKNKNTKKKKKKKKIHYFSIDNELIYWNFFLDFGPLNLGQLYRFCAKLNTKLSSPEYKDCIICYFSGAKGQARANASFLICAWSMLYLGRTLEEAYFGFREEFALAPSASSARGQVLDSMAAEGGNGNVSLPPQLRLNLKRQSSIGSSSSRITGSRSGGSIHDDYEKPSPFGRLHPLPPFHDASPIVCTYDLAVYDCLQGLEKARHFGFFKFGNNAPSSKPSTGNNTSSADENNVAKASTPSTKPPRHPSTFNADEYEYFEQVENGDLNWIVQNKILAFAGPQNQKLITPEGFCMLTPGDYIPYYLQQNVKIVIRLNKKCYDEEEFRKVGIRHVQHYYLDGSCPPLRILHAVVADMESIEDDQAMAVHCKAGLGRTGTCIGAYLMKHYRLTASEVIGWMRICRPGMVIGPQQHFLVNIEGLMWQEGDLYRQRGSGLRKMSIESAAATPAKTAATAAAAILATPQTKAAHSSGRAHVSIVTPDGQPLQLPTTPVVTARKLDMKSGDMMIISPPSTKSPDVENQQHEQLLHSNPSSTSSLPTIDALKVDSSTIASASASETLSNPMMQEGDQANALLARRLDQFQARHPSK